jgi:acetolactate synthase I/II/III large subunit
MQLQPRETTRSASATMLGSDLVLRALEAEGVEVCFGMPGGAILPIYDAIARGTTVRHVLARHEQGAGHMAQGYARASGLPGVVLATSGPGATNLVTPIADAAMDSTPLVCITGQVSRALIGTNAFQECDIVAVTTPLVKRAWQVLDVADLERVLHEAFALARGGRPGPVLVDIPRDVQLAEVSFAGLGPNEPPPDSWDLAAASAAAELIGQTERPVLYVGGGVANGRATAELRALAEAARIPVVTTLMAKGAFPEDHELFAGWPGMHGTVWANHALNLADVVIAVGARFDDRVTGRLDRFAEHAKIVHLDIDPREIGKLRAVDVGVLGALAPALDQIRRELGGGRDTSAWLAQIDAWRAGHPLAYDSDATTLKPQAALERLDELARDSDPIYTTGVGQHQMWAMQYLRCRNPRSFITSGGHGTMGFGLPAAIGARAARPDAPVICIDGDGSFQMTLQELATAVSEQLPVTVVILNNQTLGMVDQWQTTFYAGRRSHVDVTGGHIDFATIARGFGAEGVTVGSLDELDAALAGADLLETTTVIDVRVELGEACLPMIAPGAAATEMVEWEAPGPR